MLLASNHSTLGSDLCWWRCPHDIVPECWAMLAQRHRWRANISPALGQHLVFAGAISSLHAEKSPTTCSSRLWTEMLTHRTDRSKPICPPSLSTEGGDIILCVWDHQHTYFNYRILPVSKHTLLKNRTPNILT